MFFAVNVIFFAVVHCTFADNSFVANLRGRVVNGTETNIDRRPYQASIQLDNQHCCGGVLISSKHVLTVAHCLRRLPVAYRLKVRLGSSGWRRNGITVRVESYRLHPEFDLATLYMDVAIIDLKNDVVPNMRTINKIRIASETAINGMEATASGWGVTRSGEIHFQDNLREIHLRIVSRELCAPFYSNYQLQIRRSMICASAVYRDVCFGDSGGPLVANGQLVGIVSWGFGCANSSCPGVYTDVSYMRLWIEENVKQFNSTKCEQ